MIYIFCILLLLYVIWCLDDVFIVWNIKYVCNIEHKAIYFLLFVSRNRLGTYPTIYIDDMCYDALTDLLNAFDVL